MLFDWSAECAEEDPVLVVPWSSDGSDPAGTGRFIDLREDPYAVEGIPEAERYPPLLHALRALNGRRSPVFTAKCDAWIADTPEELDALRVELGLEPDEAHTGFVSYIDLLWRDRNLFASFHQHEHLLHRFARRLAPVDQPHALIECVIRPALLDLESAMQGFATTLYVKALGSDGEGAAANWAAALESAVAILRSRDFTPNT